MPPLDAKRRARLPDSAFAYVDSRGQRRLPIHDRAHVRNALARFRQVAFETEAARERARASVLRAASRHGIMPIGFINGQLRAGATDAPRRLPSGQVTFLFTDMEDSTGLVQRLGNDYPELLEGVRVVQRVAVGSSGGHEVDSRADEFFAVFQRAPDALEAALAAQRGLRKRDWPGGVEVRVRMGIHSGRPTLTGMSYVGIAVNTAARVCSAAHGGQILVSGDARAATEGQEPEGVELRRLGDFRLRGLQRTQALFHVVTTDLPVGFPPPFSPAVATIEG